MTQRVQSSASEVRDPVFPRLEAALDAAVVRDELRNELPECAAGLGVEEVKIYNVQYTPGTSCKILYSVKFRRPDTGRSETLLLSAVLLPDGRQPNRPSTTLVARYQAVGDRLLHNPVVHLPGAGLVAHVFPFDPRLPGLVGASDPETMKRKLGRMWKERGLRVRRVTIKPMGLTPGARAAMSYEILGESRHDQVPEIRRLVGKIDVKRVAADLFARSWSIWKDVDHRIPLAPPVGYLLDPDLFLQEYVDGTRLSDLAGTGDFISPVRQTARAVAVLHTLQIPLRARRPQLQSVKAVHRWGKTLEALRPHERDRIRSLCDKIEVELERRAMITGPIHGDLHPSNVLVSHGRATLIDLDNMVLGDRLLDVGRFLSALRTSAIRACGSLDGLADAGESFLERYLYHAGEDERRARLFEAASLLTSAGTGFRLQRAGWEESASLLIDEAERVLRLAMGPSPARQGKAPAAFRSSDVKTAWASDAVYLRAVISPHVLRVYGAELSDCSVEPRRATDRRPRLRLKLVGWRGETRWKQSIEGVLWPSSSGRKATERLDAVHRALENTPFAQLLPRPIAFIREIDLQLLEPPVGESITSCLAGNRAGKAVEELARALGFLHQLPIDLDKSRSPADELKSLRSRIGRLDPGPRAIAEPLLSRIEGVLGQAGDERAPVLRHFSLRRLLYTGSRVAIDGIDDVVLSHRFVDAADLLARFTYAAMRKPDSRPSGELADRFRSTYMNVAGGDSGTLAAFEAAALLRLAYAEASPRSGSNLAGDLFEVAEQRLDAGRVERKR